MTALTALFRNFPQVLIESLMTGTGMGTLLGVGDAVSNFPAAAAIAAANPNWLVANNGGNNFPIIPGIIATLYRTFIINITLCIQNTTSMPRRIRALTYGSTAFAFALVGIVQYLTTQSDDNSSLSDILRDGALKGVLMATSCLLTKAIVEPMTEVAIILGMVVLLNTINVAKSITRSVRRTLNYPIPFFYAIVCAAAFFLIGIYSTNLIGIKQ